jgi:hypothetical protein
MTRFNGKYLKQAIGGVPSSKLVEKCQDSGISITPAGIQAIMSRVGDPGFLKIMAICLSCKIDPWVLFNESINSRVKEKENASIPSESEF